MKKTSIKKETVTNITGKSNKKISKTNLKVFLISKVNNLAKIFKKFPKKQKQRIIFFAGLAIILLPIFYLSLKKPAPTEAGWWDEGWLYRKEIAISYSGSTTLTDFQVELDEVDVDGLYSAGKLQSACQDLRFVDQNGTLLEHWIEDENDSADAINCTSSDYDIWVRIPQIQNGGGVIYMYYGNASVAQTRSNGNATFDFFDDFGGSSIDLIKWDQTEDSITITGGNLLLNATNDAYDLEGVASSSTFSDSNPQTNDAAVLTFRAKQDNANANGLLGFSNNNDLTSGFETDDSARFNFDTTTGGNHETATSNEDSDSTSTVNIAENTSFHEYTIKLDSTASTTFEIDGSTDSIASNNPNEPMYVRLQGTDTSDTFSIDHVFVRKLATTEPTTPAYGSYGSEEIGPGPISQWKLDEGYGSTVYDSAHGHNGNLAVGDSSPTWKTEETCVSGKCLYFDSSDYITISDSTSFNFNDKSFSFGGWFKTNDITTDNRPMGKYQDSYDTYEIAFGNTSNKISYYLRDADGNNTGFVNSTSDFESNRWYHVMVVVDQVNETSKLYVNGAQEATASVSTLEDISPTGSLVIGSYTTTQDSPFHGFIDEVKFYPYARSASEIKSDYIKGASSIGSSAVIGRYPEDRLNDGLIGYWKMDDSSGDATDYSGNSNDLTNNCTTTFTAGKFGGGSEHDPASTQYFSLSSGTGQSTYYFDASDGGPYDSVLSWYLDSFAFDGLDGFYAYTVSRGSASNQYLMGEGTNSSSSGSTISSVEARLRGEAFWDSGNMTLSGQIYTDGTSESLGTPTVSGSGMDWGDYSTLATPTGGWTWEKIQALEIKFYMTDFTDRAGQEARAAKAEVRVNYGSSGSDPSGVKTISLWVNPDNTTNYYFSLDGTSYLTSSSGTLSVSGFSNSTIYVNGEESSTISADQWQMITVTADTAVDATQFYVGRVGSNYFDGTIDEFRLYNRALSPAEIKQLYNWAPGPIAYWDFNENEGTSTVYDKSGNNLNGTITAMESTDWVPGKYGSALDFDGSNEYVSMGDQDIFDNLKHGTVCAWVKHDTATTDDFIFSNANASEAGFMLMRDDAGFSSGRTDIYKFLIADSTDGGYYDHAYVEGATDSATAGEWRHVCGTFILGQENGLKLYVNGIEDPYGILDSTTDTTEIEAIDSGANSATIGIHSDGSTSPADGIIDEVKIWNYALTAKQIIQDMNAGHPAPGSPVGSAVSHYKFDEGYGTVAHDNMSAKNDLTLSAAAWTNDGKYGKAWNGNGTVYLSRADDPDFDFSASDDFTLSGWFKHSTIASNPDYIIVKAEDGTNAGYKLYMASDGDIVFEIDDDATWGPDDSVTSTSADYDDGDWHNFVVVKDDTTDIYLYLDGKLVDSEGTVDGSGDLTNNDTFYIGVDDDGSSNAFDGELDEIKIYRAAMTASQVLVEYNQGKATTFGTISTDGTGSAMVTSNSAAAAYCPPGDTTGYCEPPVGEWLFDENAGIYSYDTSENSNTGTLTNDPAWIPGMYGSALKFDGSNDYINIPDSSVLDFGTSTDFTASAWVKLDSDSNETIIMDGQEQGGSADGTWRIFYYQTNNALRMELTSDTWNNYCTIEGSTDLVDEGWHQVTGVVNRNASCTTNDILLYVDGLKESTSVIYSSANTNANIDNDDPLTIGAYYNLGSRENYTYGLIDNIKIYNYARTPEQIAWDYNRGKPIAYYKLDECQGTTAYDSSGNGYDGTITITASGDNTSAGTCNSGTGTEAWNNGTDGKRNASLDFDGTNDYISLPSNDPIWLPQQNMSVSAWIKLDSTAAAISIVDGNSGESGTSSDRLGWYLRAGGGGVSGRAQYFVTVNNTSYQISVNDLYQIGEWVHLVGIRKGTDSYLYANGKLADSLDTLPSTDIDYVGNYDDNTVSIGRYIRSGTPGLGIYFADGQIDEVKIYNYALTEQQILTDYYQGAARFGPSEGSPD